MARDVTTVAGATSIRVHCEFTDKDGQLLLARDINGKVRFFGGNLKATNDFAKKAAIVAYENVSPGAGTDRKDIGFLLRGDQIMTVGSPRVQGIHQ